MPIHVFVRFDGKAGRVEELRRELLSILDPTRAEPGCVDIHLYEGKNAPGTFFIHSRWEDDATIDTHLQLPHMKRFQALLDDLVVNTVKAVRTQQIN